MKMKQESMPREQLQQPQIHPRGVYEGGMKLVLQTANEALGKSTFTSKMVFSASRPEVHPVSENDKKYENRVIEPTLAAGVLVGHEKELARLGFLSPPLFDMARRNINSSSGHWNYLQPMER